MIRNNIPVTAPDSLGIPETEVKVKACVHEGSRAGLLWHAMQYKMLIGQPVTRMKRSRLSGMLKQEFNLLSRKLTYMTIAVVCVLALILWWLGIEVKGNTATIIGAMFIGLAALTFKIPYIAYRFMLNKYRNEPDKIFALGPSWQEFRSFAMQRK